MIDKWICLECRWIGTSSELVTGHDPWGDEVKFCPTCHEPGRITSACDEPGCMKEGTCGFPTSDGGYRRTCGDHSGRGVMDVPESACLNCGKKVDAATTIGENRMPRPGDISMCYCGHLQAYGDDLQFRALTDEEMLEIAGHPKIILASKLIEEWRTKRGNG